MVKTTTAKTVSSLETRREGPGAVRARPHPSALVRARPRSSGVVASGSGSTTDCFRGTFFTRPSQPFTCHKRVALTDKRVREQPKTRCSPPPIDKRDPIGVINTFLASWIGVGYLIERGARRDRPRPINVGAVFLAISLYYRPAAALGISTIRLVRAALGGCTKSAAGSRRALNTPSLCSPLTIRSSLRTCIGSSHGTERAFGIVGIRSHPKPMGADVSQSYALSPLCAFYISMINGLMKIGNIRFYAHDSTVDAPYFSTLNHGK
ncbi:hypothetical protein EVAR_43257_1 [Eumeta japonica]|uniref:Uncharacterized protein n=1 Tax=Eumeta variegata TaxID=151549 RepID=A0A4C1WUD8_EUMVA|nr:hypothetical protein EVAR_43257_1 [Eumeta japonica]